MKMKKMVPIITTDEFDGVKAFFEEYFGFKTSFESPEYLGLTLGDQDNIELAFMKPGCEGQPSFNNQGLTYCFEVEDVDQEYSRLQKTDVTFLQPVQDNPWGDRSFIVSAPKGVAIYTYQAIPPKEEFKEYHKK